MNPQARRQPSAAELSDAALVALGRETFAAEARTLNDVEASLDASFAAAVRALLACEGRVLVTGLGKSGIVARKLAATLTSTGTPSHFIHPVEAAHGDLGVVRGAEAGAAATVAEPEPEYTAESRPSIVASSLPPSTSPRTIATRMVRASSPSSPWRKRGIIRATIAVSS